MEPDDLRQHFLIRKEHQRTVSTKDDSPLLLWNHQVGSPCHVCYTNQARYTCPRCSLSYCSVSCFQAHNNNDNNTCTESFYQERVHNVLNLEIKAKTPHTRQIIQREHEQHSQTYSGIAPCGVPEEQLYELLLALENKDEDKIQKLLLQPYLRVAVARGIQQEDLHEWLLDPWTPWWMPQLFDVDTELIIDNRASLDQHILNLPPLHSLRAGPSADLRFNTLELLYAMAWTCRLYYGPHNAQDCAEQAVGTLLTASSVLAHNHSFDTLEAVLTYCATTSTNAQVINECNASWRELTTDAMMICQNKRFVMRCLLEARCIVKKAADHAKQTNDAETRTKLKRIGKKIEFYTSWNNAPDNQMSKMVPDIRDWIETWSEEEPVVVQLGTPREDSNPIRFDESDTSPLLQEISTSRKTPVNLTT